MFCYEVAGKMTFNARIIGSLGLVALSLATIGLISYRSTTNFIETTNAVNRSHQVLKNTGSLLTDLMNIETSVRGFVISTNEVFLEPYQVALPRMPEHLKTLRALTAAEPNQQRRLNELEPLILAKVKVVQTCISTLKKEGIEAASRLNGLEEGQRLMDRVRVVTTAMEDEEQQLLNQREERSKASAHFAMLITTALNMVMMVLLTWVSYTTLRYLADRKRVEEELARSYERLELSQKAGRIGHFEYFFQTNTLVCSELLEALYGVSKHRLGGTWESWMQCVHPEDRKAVNGVFEEARKNGQFDKEFRIIWPDNSVRWIQMRAEVHFDTARNPLRMVGVNRDITARKQAEEKAADTAAYARSLIEASLDPMVTIAADGRISDANHAAEMATGVPREELIGKEFSNYFTEPEKARAVYRQVFARGSVADCLLCIRHTSGSLMDVLYNATLYKDTAGHVRGVFATARDITQRKKAEEALRQSRDELELRVQQRTADLEREVAERKLAEGALRQSEEKFRRIAANIPEVLYSVDMRTQEFRYLSPAFEKMLGYTEEDIHNEDGRVAFLTRVIKKGDFEAQRDRLARLQTQPMEVVGIRDEEWWLCKDGTLKCIEDRWIPVYQSGRLVTTEGVLCDITELKEAQETVRRAKEDWERTFDAVPDLIAIIDSEHRIVRTNKAMAARLGVTPAQCVGQTCYRVVHGTDEPPDFCPHKQLLADGIEHTARVYEDRLGGDFIVSTTPLYDSEGKLTGSIHIAREITERKQAGKTPTS
ncbi:MAG: hypothetical protein A2107_13690 [Verrucomicrobia bacterium GWF2_62_7]|nr:MAG: hypothetical protein A2107_13690 [Verrucomicrobia bacterium GWF2_62_7]